MKRRDLNPSLLADAESITGCGFEFQPEHDLVNAGKPLPPAVELTPVGPPATVYEFLPEHDRVNAPRAPEKETAFVAAVVGLVKEHVADTDRLREIEGAARALAEQFVRTLQPATTCQADTSKNSTATPSADGTSP